MLSHDGSLAVWAYGDDLDRLSEVLLHECDVVAEFCRKFLFRTAVSEICMPSLEFSIYWLDVSICVEWPLI